MSSLHRTRSATGICPDCLTHEAALCADCHTPVGCRQGLARHSCRTAAA